MVDKCTYSDFRRVETIAYPHAGGADRTILLSDGFMDPIRYSVRHAAGQNMGLLGTKCSGRHAFPGPRRATAVANGPLQAAWTDPERRRWLAFAALAACYASVSIYRLSTAMRADDLAAAFAAPAPNSARSTPRSSTSTPRCSSRPASSRTASARAGRSRPRPSPCPSAASPSPSRRLPPRAGLAGRRRPRRQRALHRLPPLLR
jgi:hypothetical protein